MTSNTPVPLLGTFPSTMLAEGVPRSSKSPNRAASATNAEVVSNDALRNGDELFDRPVLLNGLYAPSHV
jgi:hypothetical protein